MKDTSIKKVLVIGSGPIVIGQAAEFDYAGTQACRALREEGVETVLLNSNPATIMTDKDIADHVYIEPLTVPVLKALIEREKPDSILPTMGGQAGLNLAMALADEGFLEEKGVRLAAAERIGYPVVLRPAYTLGGSGGGIAENEYACRNLLESGLRLSRVHEVLVERSIAGWKEIEYEVMRDISGNVITICNMENMDPVGIHTGDSIVVAPSQTLSDREYQMLRSAALNIISELEIVGGCNVQFALDPKSFEYIVIEVNPRVSRSSALASKATGYPIARVAAKAALGYRLDEIKNAVTGKTTACFEPALDYCVVKMPRLPFDKFRTADHLLGTQMKATGEVMAISGSFEAGLMKAIRSLEQHTVSLMSYDYSDLDNYDLREHLKLPDDRRIWLIAEAFRRGMSMSEICALTGIDAWFLDKVLLLVEMERRLSDEHLSTDLLRAAKMLEFPDSVISHLSGVKEAEVRRLRTEAGILPAFKMVDTCAAEFEAETPYFYSVYGGVDEAAEFLEKRRNAVTCAEAEISVMKGQTAEEREDFAGSESANFSEKTAQEAADHCSEKKKKILILGSGPIRIGQGIEFDFCSVHAAWAFQKEGYETIIINNNPETVSTDFDIADRLYFEPLTAENVRNVVLLEKPDGAVVQFGGQTAIGLSQALMEMGVPILGTAAEWVDAAEDRERFDEILEKEHIRRPAGDTVYTAAEAKKAAKRLGYPVLVRPSYVLGGQGMRIAVSDTDIEEYIDAINVIRQEHPILVDKYIRGKELEVDAICDGEDILIPGIMEHIERTGIHSGDSISVYPAKSVSAGVKETIARYTEKLARALHVSGMINIQFIADGEDVYIIEVNPRSSRTVPYISKVTGIPMIALAVHVICGGKIKDTGFVPGLQEERPLYAVKMPVFSFEKIKGADISLGPEMKSTGECLGVSEDFEEALGKAFRGAGINLPHYRNMIMTVRDEDKEEMIPVAKRFEKMGFRIYATRGTSQSLMSAGIRCFQIRKAEQESPNIMDLILGHALDLIIDIPGNGIKGAKDGFSIRRSAVETGVHVITAVDTARALAEALENAGRGESLTDLAKLNQSLMSCEELQSEEIQMELHNCLGSAKQSR